MLKEVLKQIKHGDNIVVGVSGGADSMVLLNLLVEAKHSTAFNMHVVHVEHGIRGKESLRDAAFVENFCKNKNISYEIVGLDIPSLAKKHKQTIEQCARNQRMQLFEKHTQRGYKLFLAHNKDDNAETILMHLFRGCGIDGARGIDSNGMIYRPLLAFSKTEIIDYAKQNNIQYVTDSTNNDTIYARNHIRNNILPAVKQHYPAVVDNLVNFAQHCAECQTLIEQLIDNSWFVKTAKSVEVAAAAFNQHSLIVAGAIKRAYNLCGQWQDLESKHIDIVKDFVATAKNGATINLPHGVIAEKRQKVVIFYADYVLNNKKCTFCMGENLLPSGKTIKICKNTENIEFGDGNFYLDYHKIPQDAVWRTRREGDTFQKLGSRGKKKLNDYFTDKKLTKQQRDNVVLLASGSNILVVLGYDIAEQVKIDSETLDIIKISI